jgi:hypothetical protein
MFPPTTRPADKGALRCEQRSSSATLCPVESRNVTIGNPFNKNRLGFVPMSWLAATVYQPGAKAVFSLDLEWGSDGVFMMTRPQFLRLLEHTFVSFA